MFLQAQLLGIADKIPMCHDLFCGCLWLDSLLNSHPSAEYPMGLQTHLHESWHWFHPLQLLLITISYCMMPSMVGAAHLSNETDRQALLAFKDQISNDPYKFLNSWNASIHFCSWQGVFCGRRHRRVTALNLSTLGLEGRISPHLGNLSFLGFITLPNNSFHGEIPREMGRLSRLKGLDLSYNSLEGAILARLSNCSHLRIIDLTHNKFVGDVPPELGLLSKLNVLYLGVNNLKGVFPPLLANLSSLVRVSLAYNIFHGVIPEEVGKISGLTVLALGGNKFIGELPRAIYNLSNLERLGVEDNQLSGSLSPQMGDFFPNLQLLSVFENNFSGSIPNSLSNTTHLESLAFSNNHFHGSMTIDFGKLQNLSLVSFYYNELGTEGNDDLHFINSLTNCSRLQILEVGGNKLKGPLPESISNLSSNLLALYLGESRIYGRIPSGIENLLSLEDVTFEANFLTGSVPDGIGKLRHLGKFNLHDNNLSGEIPASLGNLSQLFRVSLGANQFEGRVPLSLGNCSSLEALFVDDNILIGKIPSQLFNLRSITELDLSSNLLSGNLPLEVGQLQSMNKLDLSNNELSGEIPKALGKCNSIVSLDLSHNSFAGSIPLTLGDLRAAEVMDFSNNNLSGMIPTYFTEFRFLQLLNLSFNDLVGEVPDQGPFQNASIISVLGNSNLCGGILELHLPSCQEHGRKTHKRTSWLKVALPLTVGSCILFFACCLIVWYWRKRPRNEQPLPLAPLKEQHLKVTYIDLHRATNGFSKANLIGSGSFGSVFKGTSDSYQMDIVVKVIRTEYTDHQGFTAECDVLKKIRHRNIVKILTSCTSLDFQGKEFKALVFKYMPNGNLESWLHPDVDQDLYLSFNKRLDVAIDIAHALDYLHNHCETPIVHCDLKPNNILLDEDMIAHVSDFSLAQILLNTSHDSSCTSMLKGSVGYIPPEYGTGHKVTPLGDVYSYGILLLELFMGKRPTNRMFNDGVNISKHAQMSFQERLMEIVDPRLLLKENIHDDVKFQNCLSSVIQIGIACSMEVPQDRTNIGDVCIELQIIREIYHKGIFK